MDNSARGAASPLSSNE